MSNKRKDDYKINFQGATISKTEAQRVGIALLFAFPAAALAYLIFGIENQAVVFLICAALAALGYFGIAPKIMKK